MTVSYELSVKLHEKYPEMGRESYFVHAQMKGFSAIDVLPRQSVLSREYTLPVTILAPALTLGELYRIAYDLGWNVQFHTVSHSSGISIDCRLWWRMGFHDQEEDINVPEAAIVEGCDTWENALAQVILEWGDVRVSSEKYCELCGDENPVWSADNLLWNSIMRNDDGSDRFNFLCPTCFMLLAVRKNKHMIFYVSTPQKEAKENE